tara:strand:- start:2444 stop:3283 length:840 start_codon:yes stop_codon:yes gene_type:complete
MNIEMANIIPMAGLGSRFSKEGYSIPKALIPVSGVPMIVQVIRNMPKSDKWIFIVRQEHVEEYQIDKIVKDEVPSAIVVSVNQTTLGQANTCLLAQAYLEPNEDVFISACDNICKFDVEEYNKLVSDESIDSVVFTFTKMEKMRTSPHSYGWVVLGEDQRTITNMSVKVPVSENPFNDHAVVASFYFKKSKDFFAAINLMIAEDYRTNNEFYVDSVPVFLNKLGKRSVHFDVDQFICWGTPTELQEYQFWEEFFETKKDLTSDLDANKHLFWRNYFENE